jgi:amidase
MTAIPEYATCDALGLAALVREGKVSPLELCDEAIRRIERTNPKLNAVVTPMFESARHAAAGPLPSGPFRGVPFLLKDLAAACAGFPLSEGSRFFAAQRPGYDSTLVRRYRQAGLVFVGKTNTPELGILPVTEPELWGPAHNPWRAGHTPGGSSGGSAAAVAAGLVPAAHGGDGGGSLRIPGSCCGLFALKPTRARTPPGPDRSELLGGLAVEHAITRSVRDSAALLDLASGPDPDAFYPAPAAARPFLEETRTPPGRLRIAVSVAPPFPGEVHPDCAAAAEEVARLCADLGHQVERRDLALDRDTMMRDLFTVACVEVAAAIAEGEAEVGRRARRRDFERDTWLCALIGRRTSAVAAMMARHRLQAAARQVAAFFTDSDLLLTPTLALPPVRFGALAAGGIEGVMSEVIASLGLRFLLGLPGVVDRSVRRVLAFTPFTPLANITGQPAMNVPLCWNADGLPIGTMFTARYGDEATLYRLAAQLETARPWAGRRPPVHADA